MGINVFGIFGRCGAVQGDWNLDVPVEAVRNRPMRLCGRDGSGSMPMVRSIYPSFLGMLILVTLPDALPIFAAVLGGRQCILRFWRPAPHRSLGRGIRIPPHRRGCRVRLGLLLPTARGWKGRAGLTGRAPRLHLRGQE